MWCIQPLNRVLMWEGSQPDGGIVASEVERAIAFLVP